MKKIGVIFFVIGVIIIVSCRKAGTGGKATLLVYPEHHGTPIINLANYPDTVFLKFNADELPGTKPSDYDVSFIGTKGEAFVRCDNLKAGKYFVYAVGYDSSYLARVMGGLSVKIKYKERKDEIDLTVALTE